AAKPSPVKASRRSQRAAATVSGWLADGVKKTATRMSPISPRVAPHRFGPVGTAVARSEIRRDADGDRASPSAVSDNGSSIRVKRKATGDRVGSFGVLSQKRWFRSRKNGGSPA